MKVGGFLKKKGVSKGPPEVIPELISKFARLHKPCDIVLVVIIFMLVSFFSIVVCR